MDRYICANCGFVFDYENDYGMPNPICPKCGSNACDVKNIGSWEIISKEVKNGGN